MEVAESEVRMAKEAERGWTVSVEAATPAVSKEVGREGATWVTVEVVMAAVQWVVAAGAMKEDA